MKILEQKQSLLQVTKMGCMREDFTFSLSFGQNSLLREREEKMGMKRLKYQGQQVTNDMLNLVLAEAEIFLFCLLKIRRCWNL